ncbi:PIR protein [Plasmodium vivax]|uniref:VIR protein n=1 Tax=Plasmodium vivax TaxID=5855 RepID=A0A565A480_PLAVI|nr:PIR protein [Plasmodium vivax]
MEFSELKEKYQFLGEILKVYDILDKPVVENGQQQENFDLCNIAPWLRDDIKGEYKNFCKKLLNNLLLLAHGNYGGDNFFKYCDILYMWMYFEIKKRDIPNDIAGKIFNDSYAMINSTHSKTLCPYLNFNEKHQEPTRLMKLRIFEYNTSTFQKILNNISDPDNCSCLEYVYECINIYNDMNKKFCAKPEDINTTYKATCDILKNFNSNYSSYIRNVKGEIYELPFLSTTTTATTTHTLTGSHATRCLLNKQKLELGSGAVHQSSSPKQISISTALSTMAGIPPFLALIYKFTPVGTWFRSKYRKDADVFKNVGEEIEKEVYSPRHENSIINSGQERYNVAYEQI